MKREGDFHLKIESGSSVVAAANQVSCELAGEAAILNLRSGVYYGLNPVGAFIWKLIQQPQPVAGLLEAVWQEYEVDRAKCEEDLMRLLNDLAEHNLIETV